MPTGAMYGERWHPPTPAEKRAAKAAAEAQAAERRAAVRLIEARRRAKWDRIRTQFADARR